MGLKEELGLKKSFATLGHEALLNIYYTGQRIRKAVSEFLKPYGLTDVQLNLMMMLKHQGGDEGLSQADLSRMLLVNRANVTGLVDRMERDGMVIRTDVADRRYNIIKLTAKGQKLLMKVESAYGKEVARKISVLSKDKQKIVIEAMERIRANL